MLKFKVPIARRHNSIISGDTFVNTCGKCIRWNTIHVRSECLLNMCVCLCAVRYEKIKFLVIALKNAVEVYAWAPKPYHKFMAFKVSALPLLAGCVHSTTRGDVCVFGSIQGIILTVLLCVLAWSGSRAQHRWTHDLIGSPHFSLSLSLFSLALSLCPSLSLSFSLGLSLSLSSLFLSLSVPLSLSLSLIRLHTHTHAGTPLNTHPPASS